MSSVLLAVGHGITPDGTYDPGAVGNGWSEQSAGDVIVAAAAERLRAAGIEVHSEANAPDPNFVGSTNAANAFEVDAVVAVHHDIRTAPRGCFAYHYEGSDRGERLASLSVEALHEAGEPYRNAWRGPGRGFADGPVTDRNLYILRETRMPATLLEVGPIGAFTRERLVELGKALAAGVAAFLGVPLVQPAGDPVEPAPQWEQVVVYDPATDGRDLGAATVLAESHRLRLLPVTSTETANEAYLVGKASYTAERDRYLKTIDVTVEGAPFAATAREVGRWVEELVRL